MSPDLDSFLASRKADYSYADILTGTQEFISSTYQDLLSGEIGADDKRLIKDYIRQYLVTKNIKLSGGITTDELTDMLYKDMAEFSFITDWLENAEALRLEEININAWNDIEIITAGKRRKANASFLSPQHAIDVVRRMLQSSDTVIDDARPTALGSLAKNIRITVLKTPILDDDVGVAASIRIISHVCFTRENLSANTASGEMLDFLATIIKYGISVCIAGNTGSGKTSTASWLLSTIPDSKRIYTIEEGSREFDLVKYDKNGKPVNSVIHTLTKTTIDHSEDITQEDLLDFSLRFDPDVICVGEMRSREAFAAQEAARTGHTVITTIHAKSAVGAYMRMTTLAKRAYEFTDETLMKLMIEAFPIIVYQRQLEDGSRKITEIIEGIGFSHSRVEYRTLFKYSVDDNIVKDGKTTVVGHFERERSISGALREELLQNGAPKSVLDSLLDRENDTPARDLGGVVFANQYEARQYIRQISAQDGADKSGNNNARNEHIVFVEHNSKNGAVHPAEDADQEEIFVPEDVDVRDETLSLTENVVNEEAVPSVEDTVREETASPGENTVREEEVPPVENTVREEAVPPDENTVREEAVPPAENIVREEAVPPAENTVREETASPVENTVRVEAVPPVENTVREEAIPPVENTVLEEAVTPVENTVREETASPAENKVTEEEVTPVENTVRVETVRPAENISPQRIVSRVRNIAPKTTVPPAADIQPETISPAVNSVWEQNVVPMQSNATEQNVRPPEVNTVAASGAPNTGSTPAASGQKPRQPKAASFQFTYTKEEKPEKLDFMF